MHAQPVGHSSPHRRLGWRRMLSLVAVVGAITALVVTVERVAPASASASGGEFVAATGRLVVGNASAPSGAVGVPVTGRFGVPASGVSAVQVTVSGVSWVGDGWVSAWPTGAPTGSGGAPPVGSNVLAVNAGDRIANTAIVALGPDGAFQLHRSRAGSVVVDLQGYFTTAGSGSGGFRSMTPKRMVDTRAAAQPTTQPGVVSQQKLPANGSLTVQATGASTGVASGATAVVVNVTTLSAVSTQGYLRVNATGQATGPAVYYPEGADSTEMTVPLSSSGQFTVFSSQAVHVVIDLQGWFEDATDASATFTPQMSRLVDHRVVAAGATTDVVVAGIAGVPEGLVGAAGGTSAVALDVIENQPGAATPGGYLRVWPYVAGGPSGDVAGAAGLQYDAQAGDQRTNMVTIGVGASDAIRLVNHSASPITLTIDLQGYYTTAPTPALGCAVDYQHRLNSSYVTVFPHTDLAHPNTTTRDAAWRQLIKTLYAFDCISRVSLTSMAEAHPGTLPGPDTEEGARLRAEGYPENNPSRYYASTEPLAVGQTQVDALGSLQRAISTLPVPGPSSFRVTLGLRTDVTVDGRFADWSDTLGPVATAAAATSWAVTQSQSAIDVATDIWTAYPSLRPMIEGWHLPPEPTQVVTLSNGTTLAWTAPQTSAFRQYLVRATAGLDALHFTNTITRTDVAPSYKPGTDPVTVWKPWLESLIKNPAGTSDIPAGTVATDIVGVQDRLWSYDRSDNPTAPINGMQPYFAAARSVVDAINTANIGHLAPGVHPMQLWSDVEMFEPGRSTATAPIGNIIDALNTEAPYVDGFTSYSAQVNLTYGSYHSPTFGLTRPEGEAYNHWVNSGTVPANQPNAPTVAVSQAGGDVTLSVTATDNPIPDEPQSTAQVQQVWVYRRIGSGPYQRIAVCFRSIYGYAAYGCGGDDNPNEATLANPDTTQWPITDPQVEPGTSVTYKVFTINLSGNQSPATITAPFQVNEPAHSPTNLALNKPYKRFDPETGIEAEPTTTNAPERADTGHIAGTWSSGETTDGYPATATTSDTAWHAFTGPDAMHPLSIATTIDLGGTRTIGEVTAQVLQMAGPGILAPASVTVYTSTTGVFTDPGGKPLPAWATGWRPTGLATVAGPATKTYRIAAAPVQARYLRIVISNQAWLFLSEIAAYAPAA